MDCKSNLNYQECCCLTIYLIISRCPQLSWKSYFSLILKLLMLLWFRKLSSCSICYTHAAMSLYFCMLDVAFVSSTCAPVADRKLLAISLTFFWSFLWFTSSFLKHVGSHSFELFLKIRSYPCIFLTLHCFQIAFVGLARFS